jgi:hypothetical protein
MGNIQSMIVDESKSGIIPTQISLWGWMNQWYQG